MWRRVMLITLLAIGSFFSWLGVRAIAGAHAAEPVLASGTLASFDDQKSRLTLGNASIDSAGEAYYLNSAEFHPSLPDLAGQIGTPSTIWYDRGTSNIVALEFNSHRYAMDYFQHPRSKYWDMVSVALLKGSPGFVILLGFAIWLLRKTRTTSTALPDDPRRRRMFQLPDYPRSPIALPRSADAIVADFKSAMGRTVGAKARPDSLLTEKREEIIEALFDEAKRKQGVLNADELDRLKTALHDLQTFVPAESAALVARHESALDVSSSAETLEEGRNARAVLARIAAGQAGVANFRYEEPEYLKTGVNFMIDETLKWGNPEEADAAFQDSAGEGLGYLAYALYGVAALVLYFAASVRWGSMQFWVLLVGTLPVIAIAVAAGMRGERIPAGSRLHFAWVPPLLIVAGSVGAPPLLLWLANFVAFSF
jgi:hypothetical protein